MPAPLPLAVRRLIQQRAGRGETAAAIARALHLCSRTVRQLLQRFRDQPERLAPCYQPGPGRPAAQHPLYTQAVALRLQHPTWGAGYLRVRLAQGAEPATLPSERTLQRWFRQRQQPPAAPGRRPASDKERSSAPHDIWQMDAVEPLRLGSGQGVSWLRLVDEYSGAFLGTTVFPLYYWAYVPTTDVQQTLRAAFTRWGLPRKLRVDNGKPWGSWNDLLPALALWLIGLGIDMVWNDPRRPQQNGVVERAQGTGKRWAEPHRCHSVAELQSRLDEDDRLQRECYPLLQQRSRWDLFPGLAHSGRCYAAAAEAQQWDLQRVCEHLAGYAVPRQVDCQGKVSVYNRNLYIGVVHAGQQVSVQYDPEPGHWLISDAAGRELRTKPAPEISAASIRNLQIMGQK